MDRLAFGKLIKALAILVPRFAPRFDDNHTLSLWHAAFEGYDDERKFAEVCALCRDHCDEFPSIKELKEYYRELGGKEPIRKFGALPTDSVVDKILKELSAPRSDQ